MRLLNIYSLIFFLMFAGCNNCYVWKYKKNNNAKKSVYQKIEWKFGVAIINGTARFIDVNKLDQRTMFLSTRYYQKNRINNKDIIRAGKLEWISDKLFVEDTKFSDPYDPIIKDIDEIYYYKIKNNIMYISKNNKQWSKLVIKIVNKNSYISRDKVIPIYLIIYLKCKWFEGEYEIIGESG